MKERPQKPPKKKAAPPEEPELTPKQLKEKRRDEARQRAAETRNIVTAGTNAWTGKLPAALLNEHCQKSKWDKADYNCREKDGSFTSSVILTRKNGKTGTVDKVRFDPPADLFAPQPTPVGARNMAATYVLHRVLSHKNMKMMLPPTHRDIWIQLDEQKASALPGHAYKWREDPFAAKAEFETLQEQRKEKRQVRDQQNEERHLIRSVKEVLKFEQSTAEGQTGDTDDKQRIHFNSILTMPPQCRTQIEKTLQVYGGFRFSPIADADRCHNKLKPMMEVLVKLGFEKFQVKEALQYAATLSEALSWLLVHVPEDDLPAMFAQTMSANVRVSASMRVENGASKIRDFGFSEEVARNAMISMGSLAEAMAYLTNMLVGVDISGTAHTGEFPFWVEEIESITAIYEDKLTILDDRSCWFKAEGGIDIFFYCPVTYPSVVPGIGIKYKKKFPKYVLLEIIRATATFAESQKGDYMLLGIIDWVQENFEKISELPPHLTRLSSAVNGVIEEPVTNLEAKHRSSKSGRSKAISLDSEKLLSQRTELFEQPKGKAMMKERERLPAWNKREEIVDLIDSNRVLLVTGETGSGKSTQVVQFILDSLITAHKGGAVNIICTQPRKIAAIGLAQRVADERLCQVGDQVGYVIRGEQRVSPTTQIRFVTSGVLLRMIESDPASLSHISHIVVDEVHERSLDSDFLLIMLKRICVKMKHIKIVLMSATVDPATFINYFKPVCGTVGYVHIEGRTFPVQTFYLNDVIESTNYVPRRLEEDGVTSSDVGRIITHIKDGIEYPLLAKTVQYVSDKIGPDRGSILVFMPGVAEIERTIRAISDLPNGKEFWAIPLHASLPPTQQRLIFKPAPGGQRKIVVASNVAETSITIPDVVAVIDSGRVKEMFFTAENSAMSLKENWVSRAAATQRMGRAGRVGPGNCYKLYTEAFEREKMAARPQPEILRAPLENLYLSIKSMGISSVEKFLGDAIDSPNATSITAARNNLIKYGALDAETDELTALGMHLSVIPTDPQTAKLLVFSSIFGYLKDGLTIAAILSGKPPFAIPRDKRDEARNAIMASFDGNEGDLLAAVCAFNEWRNQSDTLSRPDLRRWCEENFVSAQTCRDIQAARRQYLSILAQIGFLTTDSEAQLDQQGASDQRKKGMLRAILSSALTPNLADIKFPEKSFKSVSAGAVEVDPEARQLRYFTASGARVFVHPSSLLFGANKFVDDACYLSYRSMLVSTKPFLTGVTPLTTYGLLFFASKIEVDALGAGLIVDGWTGVRCWPRIGILVKFLKQLFDDLLKRKFETPGLDLSQHPVMQDVRELIDLNGRV